MGLHDGHRERVKREFLSGGLAHFSEHRALELLLFFSRFQGDVNPLAHRLLETFGSLSGVMDAHPRDLAKVAGVGENTVVLLKLIPAMSSRYLASRAAAPVILEDSASLRELFVPYFFGARTEMAYLASFDAKGKLLGVNKLSEGSPTGSEISLRAVTAAALSLEASLLVLAHNHPSGIAAPSDADLFTTRHIAQVVAPLGLTLYDHVILADDDMVSLRDSGYFSTFPPPDY